MLKFMKRLSSSQIIILGFAAIILLGAFLLMLPFSTRDGRGADFNDALFTATSAVCVTGLIVRDTALYWSFFGQAVILALIQTGGMGVVTVAIAVAKMSGKTISLKQRSTLQEAISAHHVGGIGFMTLEDIKVNKNNFKKYSMQSKVILVTTAALIFIPAIYFFIFEFDRVSPASRAIGALFQSVTTRTAGFNTLDLTVMSEVGLAVMIILMLTGGSPGSTAGGMKTTTFAVMIYTTTSVFRRREHTNFFGRRVEENTVRNAVAVFTLYIFLFISGGFAISIIEGLPLLVCLYETASAVGTVGLTLGITPQLCVVSRAILILLMYTGRVGGLTLIFAAVSGNKGNTSRLPQAKITEG